MSELLLSQNELETLAKGLLNGATVADASGINPDTLESLYALAHGFYTSSNFHDAQVVFQALTLYNPNDYRFWLGLAGCRQAQEQFESAIEAYRMAGVASSLKNPEPFLHAAHCLVKLGRREDAVSALKGVLEIGADDPRYEAVRQRATALINLLKGE